MSTSRRLRLMLTVAPDTLDRLNRCASARGINIQELLRAVVIPKWLDDQPVPAEASKA